MSSTELVKTLEMGKGTRLDILRDPSKSTSDPHYWVTKVITEATDPDDEPVFVPLHWHKRHTEHFTILEGRVRATVDGVERVLNAGDTVVIPPYTVHGFRGFKGEKVKVQETAEPAGHYKVVFFNDLLQEGWPAPFWVAMRAFYDGDAYPSLGLGFKFFDVVFVTIFGGLATFIAPKKSKLE